MQFFFYIIHLPGWRSGRSSRTSTWGGAAIAQPVTVMLHCRSNWVTKQRNFC